MAVKNSVQSIPLVVFDASTLTANYQVFNTGGLPHACFSIQVDNASTRAILISFDGVTDHRFLGAEAVLSITTQNQSQPNNWVALLAQGTTLYVKFIGVAGVGNIYLSGLYQN